MEIQRIEMIYDIILGTRYTLVPLYLPEIKPIGVVQKIHSTKTNNTMSNCGKRK
ncbi:MAG: hypothetical protein J6T27_03865 [Alphaproteobacteria bacterium]|nr:hypothetical protein [Alphaproteobacteria bacterium]